LVEALKTGPYGRCVYECDNDVADHQVVNMEFENGATATVTMVAFTESICDRKTRIFGSLGEIECDGMNSISYYNFLTKRKELFNAKDITGYTDLGGHGGGDFGLMQSFLYAVGSKNESTKFITSGPEESFGSHLYVFAAEHSRRTGQVVNIEDFKHNNGIKIGD
jgi:predicted dehydrogenase